MQAGTGDSRAVNSLLLLAKEAWAQHPNRTSHRSNKQQVSIYLSTMCKIHHTEYTGM